MVSGLLADGTICPRPCASALYTKTLDRRGHGFLWLGKAVAFPVYDLNPVPTYLKRHMLDRSPRATSDCFGLGLAAARAVIKEVAVVTTTWREATKEVGARPAEIARMPSAFEHDDPTGGWRYDANVHRIASSESENPVYGPRVDLAVSNLEDAGSILTWMFAIISSRAVKG